MSLLLPLWRGFLTRRAALDMSIAAANASVPLFIGIYHVEDAIQHERRSYCRGPFEPEPASLITEVVRSLSRVNHGDAMKLTEGIGARVSPSAFAVEESVKMEARGRKAWQDPTLHHSDRGTLRRSGGPDNFVRAACISLLHRSRQA